MSLDIYLVKKEYLAEANITHNLVPMWKEAGIYDSLYYSDDLEAREVLPILIDGLVDMTKYPDKYKKLNSPNGWGTYDNAVRWLAMLIEEFKENPEGIIEISK